MKTSQKHYHCLTNLQIYKLDLQYNLYNLCKRCINEGGTRIATHVVYGQKRTVTS